MLILVQILTTNTSANVHTNLEAEAALKHLIWWSES